MRKAIIAEKARAEIALVRADEQMKAAGLLMGAAFEGSPLSVEQRAALGAHIIACQDIAAAAAAENLCKRLLGIYVRSIAA